MAATVPAPISLAEQVEAIHNNLMGHLELSPKFTRIFLETECSDKKAGETYRQYLTRIRGYSFSNGDWKKLCSFSWQIFENRTGSNEMDMTALVCLFECVFKVKNDNKDKSRLMSKLKALKDLRNEVMHNAAAATDPRAIDKLQNALMSFIQVAGIFYSFSPEKINELQQKLREEIDAGFSPGNKRLLYACACAVRVGWSSMELFLRYNFASENLLFNLGEVDRSTVYHALEIILADGIRREAFPYTEIFERVEKLIVVSGSAGAGKSTMLENIALQFLDPQFCTVPHLEDFQLLVYVQCRDRITKTLGQVLKEQFSDVCTKLGIEMMIEALIHLRVLFLIDGFDEYEQSMTVLEEVMKITWQANCRIIITTRPHAVPRLRGLLSTICPSYTACEIVPLTKLEQQLDFLAKYEKYLPGDIAEGSLLDTFKNLNDSVRSLFTEPLKLLRFCDVFVTFPAKISKWTTPNHASKDIFLLYRTLVEQKLLNTHYHDLNIVVSDLFQIIAESALGFLRSNTLTFTEEQVELIQRKCRLKLKADHGIRNINVEYILSSVLKIKKPLSKTEVTTYSFAHKTDEEYFAAQYVIQQIQESKESLKQILLGEMQEKITYPSTPNEEHVPEQAPHGAEAKAFTLRRPSTSNEEDVAEQALHGADAKAFSPRLIPAFARKASETFKKVFRKLRHTGKIDESSKKWLEAQDLSTKSETLLNVLSEFETEVEEEFEESSNTVSNEDSTGQPDTESLASTPPLQPFLEVLQFVVQDLSDRHPSLLKARWSQLLEALQEAGATFDTWRDLVLTCPDDAFLVEKAALAAVTPVKTFDDLFSSEDSKPHNWRLRTSQDAVAVALMLQYAQPLLLSVEMRPDDLRRTCWMDVIRVRKGSMKLSLTEDPCDDLIAPLQNSRCRLVYFKGCVITAQVIEVVAAVTVPESELCFTLRDPIDLSALEGKCRTLSVSTAPFSIDEKSGIKAPLPAKPLPELLVSCHDPHTSWKAVASTVLTLAPDGGRYGEIMLTDDHLTEWGRTRLVVALQRRGIRTEVDGYTYWHMLRSFEGMTRLDITDRVSDRLTNIPVLIDHVAQCSKRTSWPYQADWPGQRKALEAAGADCSTWRELVLECSADERVVKGAAEAALLEDEWCMETSRDVTAVALMLHHVQPRHLRVQMPVAYLRESCWEDVAQRRVGDIALLLNSLFVLGYTDPYTPCDSLLQPLKNSRCQLVQFYGCITTAAGVAALAAVSTPLTKLDVFLKQPLSLTDLEDKYVKLKVRTRPFPVSDEGVARTRLPARPLPELYLQLGPKDDWKTVAHTVQTLAPAGSRYKCLTLAACRLDDATLEMLVAVLREKGIKTIGEGHTRLEREGKKVLIYINDDSEPVS